MGTGKTTIGRQLARRLKMDFYDSDRLIEERTGADIPLIFEKEGDLENAKSYYDKALVQMKKFKNRVQQERIEVKLKQMKSKSAESKKG